MPKAYKPNDAWAERAQKEGYRARSVYKLAELNQRFKFLKPGMKVLDVGAAPGSWLQYISKEIGPKGQALGLDLEEIEPVAPNATTKAIDISHEAEVEAALNSLGWEKIDLILSDIMVETSGIKDVDQARSVELSQAVFEIAKKRLKPGGVLVMKVFEGEDFQPLIKNLKDHFTKVVLAKPKASRPRSREMYLVCS